MASDAVEGLKDLGLFSALLHWQMPALLASMDVSAITPKTDISGAIPFKIYEAMACGLPVSRATGGEGAKIVREAGSGVVVAPGGTPALEAAGFASGLGRRMTPA